MGKTATTIVLRVIAAVSYFIAGIVMCFSSQTIEEETYTIFVSWKNWTGLLSFAVLNFIVCSYNTAILIIPSGSQLWKTIVVFDVVMTIVVGTNLGVGWQTYSLIQSGNIYVGWAPVCSVVKYFCKAVVGSLSTCSVGFFFSFVLLMYTLHVCVDPLLLAQS